MEISERTQKIYKSKLKTLRKTRNKIIIVGQKSSKHKKIKLLIEELSIEVVSERVLAKSFKFIDDNTLGIILVEPLYDFTFFDAIKQIRKKIVYKEMPVFAIVDNGIKDKYATNLYANNFFAVIEWPRDKNIFQLLMLDMLDIYVVVAQPTGKDKLLAKNILSRLRVLFQKIDFLEVRVNNGIVCLEGKIESVWKKERIIHYLGTIPGVKAVVDRSLRIAGKKLEDRRILEAVKRILTRIADFREKAILIAVKNGVVTLSGTVRDPEQLQRIKEIIYHINGVKGFTNLLKLSRSQAKVDQLTAAKIEKRIGQIFAHSKNVNVAVMGNVAVLRGKVKILEHKKLIEEFVRQQSNIKRVINKIEVK